MKRFTVILMTVMALVLVMPFQSFAAGDTLVVFASQGSGLLDKIVMGDTASNGSQLHHVYRLVTTDTTYIYNGAITSNYSVSFIGVPGVNGKLPCIQPNVLLDGSVPANLFVLGKSGTTGVFKNLYLIGLSIKPTSGTSTPNTAGIAVQISADNIKTWYDNVVFDQWLAFAVGYNGNWDSFFFTNCVFRNFVHPNQWYVGEVLRNEWPGAVYTDSIVFKYNTFVAINGYAAAPVTKYYERYFEFSHNTVAYTFKNPFFIFNVTNAKISNNIFYGAWAGATSKTEFPWWDQLWSPAVGSVIDLDSLNVDNAKMVDPADSASFNSNWNTTRWVAEAKRTIEVSGNLYTWPAAITNMWKSINDTAHVDSIYTPTWMNARTSAFFSDAVHWPKNKQSANLNQDPGFGAAITGVMTGSASTGVGLTKWFLDCRTGTLTTNLWGSGLTQVGSAINWVPTWPLPEAASLKYTSAITAPDGKPYGDPRWFNANYGPTGVSERPSVVAPFEFSLSAAYPNPFNPSTNFKYTLNATGFVSFKVYNLLGQLVKIIVNQLQTNGEYHVVVDMSNITSGVYFGVLEQGSNRQVQKIMLLK